MEKNDLLSLFDAASRSVGDLKDPLLSKLRSVAVTEARDRVLAGASDALSAAIKKDLAKLDPSKVAITAVPDAVRKALPANASAEVKEDCDDLLADLDRAGAFADPFAKTDAVVGDLPFLQEELETAKVYVVGILAGLDDAKLAKVVARLSSDGDAPSITEIDDKTLGAMVGDLSEAEVRDLGLATSLFQLCDESRALAAAVKSARIGGRSITSVRDLSALDAKAWQDLLQNAKVAFPAGLDLLAAALAHRVAALYPSDSFIRRLPVVDASAALTDRAARARLVNAYPGLGLDAVLDDPALTKDAKTATVARRVGLIGAIAAKHPEEELLFLDYAPDADDVQRLDLGGMGLSADEQRMVLSTLKAYQRAHALTDDVDHARAVITSGIGSATSAAAMGFDDFKAATGLDDATAKKHHAKARARRGRAAPMAPPAMDVVRGGFDALQVANVGPDAKDMLRKLDGFEDLFGSQDYCKCEECRSVLGPAAYFVDLMTFVDDNVRKKFFKKNGDHPLNLRTRRPDLWHLPLTCANTTTLVPTLEIANHVLENHIAAYEAKQNGSTVDLGDRAAVESWAYEKTLTQMTGSFRQPFVLPLARLTTYLRHFRTDRGDIARALGAPVHQVTRAELGLGVKEHHAITSPEASADVLGRLYDVKLVTVPSTGTPHDVAAFQGAAAPLVPVDVARLMRAMGVSRDEIGAIIQTRFVGAGAGKTRIVAGKQSAESVQNDAEMVQGLTCDALDRMHRFTRLWRRVGWSVEELDLVLTTLGDTALDASTLDHLASVRQVRQRLHTSIEETCALFGDIPGSPVTPDGTALVDRLFNAPGSGATAGLPDPNHRFLHPSLRLQGSKTPSDPALPRLLAGLRVGDDELLLLITRYLAGALGVSAESPTEDARSFALGSKSIALLYRHARLAERFGLSIPQLFQLLGLVDAIAGAVVDSLDDLVALVDFHAWWKKSGYTLDDLGFILGKTILADDAHPEAKDVAAQVIADTSASSALVFADTLLASLPGVTEEISRAILGANPASIEKIEDPSTTEKVDGPEQYRLADGFDGEAPLTIPADLGLTKEQVDDLVSGARGLLRGYHPVTVVPVRLSAALRIPADELTALIGILPNGPLFRPEMARALRVTAVDAPDAKPLLDLISALLPLTVLLKAPAFDAAAIAFVRDRREAFGIADLTKVDVAGVRALSVYARLAPAVTDVEFTGDPPRIDVIHLQNALRGFDATAKTFAAGTLDDLAEVLRTTRHTVASLLAHVERSGPAAMALDQLARCAAIAGRLGIGGQALAHAVAATPAAGDLRERAADEHTQLGQAAHALLGAFRARYADEAELQDKLDPYEDQLRSQKRDALTDYLVHTYHPDQGKPSPFADRRAIYEYFLIDVDLEGCARTSRVVSATNTVQLYFQRCLMGLEQDRGGDIRVTIDKDAADEWGWRKAYRVWEANRKVFLYPESYLEPELRDDKTPLFEGLEAELLQKQIDQQSVLDAYTSFMDGFEEVGKLTIAGAFQDDDDTLHLIGVTASDPPRYYYRAIENDDGPVWHPWREITVQIPVRRASPVVHHGRLHLFWIETRTQPVNRVNDGGSTFVGYKHKQTLKYTSLRLDGKWTAPQEIRLPKDVEDCDHTSGVVTDYFDKIELVDATLRDPKTGRAIEIEIPRVKTRLGFAYSKNPRDDYTLGGASWGVPYPEVDDSGLVVVMRNFRLVARVNLFRRTAQSLADVDRMHRIRPRKGERFLLSTHEKDGVNGLYYGRPTNWYAAPNAFANLVLDDDRIDTFDGEYGKANDSHLKSHVHHPRNKIGELSGDPELLAISGSIRNAIVQASADAILVKRGQGKKSRYRLERLGTTLTDKLARRLFSRGVGALLDLDFQRTLKEAASPVRPTAKDDRLDGDTNAGKLDFTGPYGVYYREIFFHIPWLIADHLNSQGQFALAQRWYHHIFDPTADGDGVDRVWRYLELRKQTWPALRDAMTDERAIRAYESDPFNPHAIARLRLSAYAKSVVMKYIDNLLDWGDRRFAAFTMESVNEATMIYAMAADILGKRPYQAGDCGEASEDELTFEKLQPKLGKGSTFLIELESHAAGKRKRTKGRIAPVAKYTVDPEALHDACAAVPLPEPQAQPAPGRAVDDDDDDDRPARGGPAWRNTSKAGWAGAKRPGRSGAAALAQVDDAPAADTVAPGAFGWSLFRQVGPAFCVPPNEDLLAYWDRVEDRLYKIHNCLDIHGRRRDLALFAPEIDPRLLVQMKAAGLSLEDVTGATSGDLPPYRFAYLIEKAKAFASTLQSFGSALLSALEKKDGEELARMRLVHEQNIAKMSTQLKQWEIDAADEAIEAATRQKTAAEFRREHYKDLMDQGLSAWEVTGQVARHMASGIYLSESIVELVASILAYVPEVGSPFAMKYGGVELSGGAARFAGSLKATAKAAEVVSSSAGLEATYDRRREEWKFQRDLADHEVDQLEKQISAARIRKQIAEKSLEVHQKTIEHTEEVHAFYADKFTSIGLYKWMATTLQRTYRHAYANVLSLARLCQVAFEFERGDAPGIRPGAGAWDGAHAGLLAGEQLLLDLQALERRFIETNYRTLEVEQSFPLTQLDPAALLKLRETGECDFEIPEVFFDLAYPGHYRRRIKAVRVTIPCVTGPYTNVGATLTLTRSQVRAKPNKDPADVPLQRTVSIATSKAQNDAGVFELSFHDERYMPFEGAGAVSSWKLTLPSSFRPFDYETISDVVLTINYTALNDPGHGEAVNKQMARAEKAIADYLSQHPLTRVFSLRREFPVAYRALLNSAPGTAVSFEIKDWHFPAFVSMGGRTIQATKAKLALKTSDGVGAGGVQLVVDGEPVEGFAPDDELANLRAREIKAFKKAVKGSHTVKVGAAGGLAPDAPPVGSGATLDQAKLVDVLLYVEYTMAT